MRVAILGATGMLGHKLYQELGHDFEVTATLRGNPQELSRYSFFCPDNVIGGVDATDLATVEAALDKFRPDAVINCIGVIKQQAAAQDPIACIGVNALFPHQLNGLCQRRGARLIHISTDCVFSGSKGSYTEADPSDAEDLYGRSKFLGEASAPALTIRTSIIGRELNTQLGLVEWFLSQNGGRIRGFKKAIFSGFTTLELSRVISDVLQNHSGLSGLYQISTEPISKYDLLHLIKAAYGVDTEIEAEEATQIDRSLDSTRFRQATGYVPPAWPELIAKMASDPTPYRFTGGTA